MDRYCSLNQRQYVSCLWHYEMNASVIVLRSQLVESGLHTPTKSPLGCFSSAKWYLWVQLYNKQIRNSFHSQRWTCYVKSNGTVNMIIPNFKLYFSFIVNFIKLLLYAVLMLIEIKCSYVLRVVYNTVP